MSYDDRNGRSVHGEAVPPPARCPVCGSPNVTTTSKVVTAESYWRCETCGEVWNAHRRHAAMR